MLQAAEEVRAKPIKFTMMDCFPPGTNILDVKAQSLMVAAQMVQASNVDLRSRVDYGEQVMDNGENNQGPTAEFNTQQNDCPSKGKRTNVELLTPPTKKQKTLKYLNRGRPLHLSNLKKKSSRIRGAIQKGRSTVTNYVDIKQQEGQWCKVVVSLSNEIEEAERCGLLGRRSGTTRLVSLVEANDVQPRRQP